MADFLPFVRRWFETTFAEATRPQREGWDAIASGRCTRGQGVRGPAVSGDHGDLQGGRPPVRV